jgi:hypothetical protein
VTVGRVAADPKKLHVVGVRLPELKPSHTAPEIGSLVRSGLWTRIAATESVSLCVLMKS